jgi:membrane protease YdiL (CAAX protease family)
MASTGTQPELEIISPTEAPSVSSAHRWIDLGLVLMVAFSAPILGSAYLASHPSPHEYTGSRLVLGILSEAISLMLFLVLFKRQGRQLKDIGFSFHWTDLPKAIGLAVAAFMMMWIYYLTIPYVYFLITLNTFRGYPLSSTFPASLWFIFPFLLLNPFFEETLVRGYLMTELIDLRKSVIFAAIISLLFQTSYHLYYGVFGAVMVGCGLSIFVIYYAKTRRLMPVILAHMIWDFTPILQKLHH